MTALDELPTARRVLPVDPEGWCSWEHGQWAHTALCREGVAYGHEPLCVAWARRDRDDDARRRVSAREQRLIDDAEDAASGAHDPVFWETAARRAAAWRAAS